MALERLGEKGLLTLIGGGEFSFGETIAADRAWIEKTPPGEIGFVPTASGSTDYGSHFKEYVEQTFDRPVQTIPIYRPRDARRGKNLERIEKSAAIYIGGGVCDHLVDTLADSPALAAIARKLSAGGTVVAIAAAAQVLGAWARGLPGAGQLEGFSWLPSGVIEPNFDPAHDRRLRELMTGSGVKWGLGLPSGSATLLGSAGRIDYVGKSFVLEDADDDYKIHG